MNSKPLTKEFLQRIHERMVEESHPKPVDFDVQTWLDLGCKTEQDVLNWIEPGT